MTIDPPRPSEGPYDRSHFFEKVDWASFGLTAILAFTVYLLTLAPQVTFEYSGIFSTAAMYPSGSLPSGHPLWALYGWSFIKLVPFSNIAWRLGVASSVAAALACGLIALVVSRVGFLLAENISNFKNFTPREQTSCRMVCGIVAGLGLAFDGGLWRKAVIVDTWPLSLFLFALSVCLVTRWFFEPQRWRFLNAAALVHGLTLSESQAFFPATFAFPFLLALGLLRPTPNFLAELKSASTCIAFFLAGLTPYLLLPLFSMTNPPINWGYPRTEEGFFHVLSRGQFDSIQPSNSFAQLMTQWKIYGRIAAKEFGVIYLIAAAVPFLFLRKFSPPVRAWVLGMLIVWVLISLLMLVGLNPERYIPKQITPFLAATHLILAMLAGCGLMLVSALFARPK